MILNSPNDNCNLNKSKSKGLIRAGQGCSEVVTYLVLGFFRNL